MKIAFVTDLHFGVKQNSEIFLKNQLDYFYSEFIPEIKSRGIKSVIVGGDVFDSQSFLNIKVMNSVYDLFITLGQAVGRVDVIVGNHDSYYKNHIEVVSLKLLTGIENVHIHNKPHIGAGYALLFPWESDTAKIKELISSHRHPPICFGHFDVLGADMYRGMKSENGLDMGFFLDQFKLTMSGHYHTRSIIQGPNGSKIVYTGSPYQITRNDKCEERGFDIIDTETYDVEFVPSKHTMKFVSVQYPNIPDPEIVKGNTVDIFVDYSTKNFNEVEFNNYVTTINEMGPAFKAEIKVSGSIKMDLSEEIGNLNLSTKELINRYVQKLSDLTDSDKPKIESLLLELYKECKGE